MSGGTKHDKDKVRLDLLSPVWLLGVGRVLTTGARRYGDHNWRKGIALSRLLGAALRHIFAFMRGEDLDEDGECHLYNASCCLMFAAEMWETRKDMDDRYAKTEIKIEGELGAVSPHTHILRESII